MGATLFISDLHLSEETPAIEAGFFAFLEREKDAEALYILGDFFEFWVGDDDDSDQIQRIKGALRACSERGTRLYLVRGNRDLALGEEFAASVGATLLGDSTVIELCGAPTLIMHGDTLCTDDVEYQQMRTILHDPAWQADMMKKPIEERRAFAQQLRQVSKEKASNKPDNIIDVNGDTVDADMAEASVTRLIHGHTHRPNRHAVAHGERVVLGDWSATLGWCVRADNNQVALESFEL